MSTCLVAHILVLQPLSASAFDLPIPIACVGLHFRTGYRNTLLRTSIYAVKETNTHFLAIVNIQMDVWD